MDFKILFESAPGLHLVLHPDLTIAAVSDAYVQATMTKRHEIVGRHVFDVFPNNPEDVTADGEFKITASFNTVLKFKTAHRMDVQKYDIRRPDGSFEERYWRVVNNPVLDPKGKVIYIINSVEDVTDYVRLQKEQLLKDKVAEFFKKLSLDMETELKKRSASEEKYRDLYESSVIAIFSVEMETQKVIDVNDMGAAILGYESKNDFLQNYNPLNHFVNIEDRIRNENVVREKGEVRNSEVQMKKRDGTLFWANVFVKLNYNKTLAQIVITDISRQIHVKEMLEGQVKERTLELTRALEREKEINEMKSRFMTIASHEFRTPLSIILSSTSLLGDYTGNDQQEKRAKHIDRIESSAKQLIHIINDFLSLEQLERGIVDTAPTLFDLPAFLLSVTEEMDEMMLAKDQPFSFEHSGDTTIKQSKKILRNILHNLLSNASKYSPEGHKICLRSSLHDNLLKITVKDHGIGISEEDQKKLFTEFFRGGNVQNIPGTGLGLSIVKKYVELLGGTISFTSEPGEGTTFVIEVPENT